MNGSSDLCATRLLLQGLVQGIGVRPAIVRWAVECGLKGWVANSVDGVTVHVEGKQEQTQRFVDFLNQHLPLEARLSRKLIEEVPFQGCHRFAIVSLVEPRVAMTTPAPRDVVLCRSCRHDMLQGENRRRRDYPFTSCTRCGPRYSILQSMPYEREATTMKAFDLCEECAREFRDAGDVRFHAQTIACWDCGPRVRLAGPSGKLLGKANEALIQAARAIHQGAIAAVKGLGGYQLICDATNEEAVRRLRHRKGRLVKPLAVMVQDLARARGIAQIETSESALLDPAGPIVLCPARPISLLAPSIHPGLRDVGLMLPTTPLHALLCNQVERPLVVTSGNKERESLLYADEEAESGLENIADFWLHHDRAIQRPIDDSVVRCMAGRTASIRLARGLAPLPLPVDIGEEILAVGSQQKVAMALSNGRQAVLGPHLGDMDTVAVQERFVQQLLALLDLYRSKPNIIAHDLHPDYFTTRWAHSQPIKQMAVQHHHAHVASGMLQHGLLDQTVLGVAFDGTGYGPDGTIWGGEFLLSTVTDFERFAHLRPFRLLGGEQAIRQPQRIALALIHDAGGSDKAGFTLARNSKVQNLSALMSLLDRPHLHPLTTSAGRLFDGAAALILNLQEAGYEGEPAMRLEAACDVCAPGSYSFALEEGLPLQLDWRPVISAMVADLKRGVEPGVMAMRFHRGLAQGVAAVTRRFPNLPVLLTGGCFQNKILVELLYELLTEDGRTVGLPGEIPQNDGGVAAGQLVVAAARSQRLR